MTVFDMALIRKYFHEDSDLIIDLYSDRLILNAMYASTLPGDKVLLFAGDGWIESVCKSYDSVNALFHPFILRLPERYQKKYRFDVLEVEKPVMSHNSDCSACNGSWNQ